MRKKEMHLLVIRSKVDFCIQFLVGLPIVLRKFNSVTVYTYRSVNINFITIINKHLTETNKICLPFLFETYLARHTTVAKDFTGGPKTKIPVIEQKETTNC